MANQMDREGHFRGRIIGYGLTSSSKSDSKAKFVEFRVSAEEIYHDGEWQDWRQYDMEAWGSLCIIKKDGTLHQKVVEDLINNAGWDGNFGSLIDNTWEPTPIAFKTNKNVYEKDGTRYENYKLAFVNHYDSTPGGGVQSTVDVSEVRSLQTQYGGQIKALAGNAKRNSPKPAGKPPSAPSTKDDVAPWDRQNIQDAAAAAKAATNDVPF